MKIVLAALNAKYTHSCLALRYLQACCQSRFPEITVREFNINQETYAILAELVEEAPDVLGFSCYIWNIEQTLELVSDLKQVLPDTKVVLGGPEVSYDTEILLRQNPEIDYVVMGEGERTLAELLTVLETSPEPEESVLAEIAGLAYRSRGMICTTPAQSLHLNTIPLIYHRELGDWGDKIIYYETSRGCPFRCAYCLSSRSGAVRYFPIERCEQELAVLAQLNVGQVRFVDRTFNCHPLRAERLLEFMANLDTTTRFQLEIAGDLISERMMEIFRRAPAGRFQLEIGVQSTNPATLQAIDRQADLEKLASTVRRLKRETKVRILLDLIAGLPDETFRRFGESFDFVYGLRPDLIQLGFLKLLKGSALRQKAASFGCRFSQKAPYEVLCTSSISFTELRQLHLIEDLVDKYYNSGRFAHTLAFLLDHLDTSPFTFFDLLGRKWKQRGYHLVNHSVTKLYRHLYELLGSGDGRLADYLRLDFRLWEAKSRVPDWLEYRPSGGIVNALIQNRTIQRYFPQTSGLSPREIAKRTRAEWFSADVLGSGIPGPQVGLFFYPNSADEPDVAVLWPDDVPQVF